MIEVIFEYLNLGYKLINVDFKGVSNTVLELKENKKEIEKKLIPYLNARNIVFKRTIEIIKTIKQNNYKNFIEIGV
jgi:tryptophan synthase alpha subunit